MRRAPTEAESTEDFAARRAAAQERMTKAGRISAAVASAVPTCRHESVIKGGEFGGCCRFCGVKVRTVAPHPMVFAATVLPHRRSVRRCGVCGMTGHLANNPRHRQGTSPPPAPLPTAVAAPVALSTAAPTPIEQATGSEPVQPAVEKIRRNLHPVGVDGRIRAKTIPAKHLTRAEKAFGEVADDYPDVDRPQTRGDCEGGQRPCPFVSCSHHLYLDVSPDTGAIKLNFPALEPWEMAETCALDVADRGGITLDEVGRHLNITRERVRQVETRALYQIRSSRPDLSPPEDRATVADQLAAFG